MPRRPVDSPPPRTADELAELSDAALLDHLQQVGAGGDEALVAEFRARGGRLVRSLVRMLGRQRLWSSEGPRGWTALHATLLLGAIAVDTPSPMACDGLVTALSRAAEEDDDRVVEAWIAIVAALGQPGFVLATRVLNDLNALERAWVAATEALAVAAMRNTVDPEVVRPILREWMQDDDARPEQRDAAAAALLDIAHPDDRDDLRAYAAFLEEQLDDGAEVIEFDQAEVDAAYAPLSDDRPWLHRSFLDHYSADARAARARYAADAAEDDEWDERGRTDESAVRAQLAAYLAQYAATLTDLSEEAVQDALFVARAMQHWAVFVEGVAPWRWDSINCAEVRHRILEAGEAQETDLGPVSENALRFLRWLHTTGRLDAEQLASCQAVLETDPAAFAGGWPELDPRDEPDYVDDW